MEIQYSDKEVRIRDPRLSARDIFIWFTGMAAFMIVIAAISPFLPSKSPALLPVTIGLSVGVLGLWYFLFYQQIVIIDISKGIINVQRHYKLRGKTQVRSYPLNQVVTIRHALLLASGAPAVRYSLLFAVLGDGSEVKLASRPATKLKLSIANDYGLLAEDGKEIAAKLGLDFEDSHKLRPLET